MHHMHIHIHTHVTGIRPEHIPRAMLIICLSLACAALFPHLTKLACICHGLQIVCHIPTMIPERTIYAISYYRNLEWGFVQISRTSGILAVSFMRQRSYRQALAAHVDVHICSRTWHRLPHIHAFVLVQLHAHHNFRLFHFSRLHTHIHTYTRTHIHMRTRTYVHTYVHA